MTFVGKQRICVKPATFSPKKFLISQGPLGDREAVLRGRENSVGISRERGGEGGTSVSNCTALASRVDARDRRRGGGPPVYRTRTRGLRDAGKLIGILTVLLRRGGLFRTG